MEAPNHPMQTLAHFSQSLSTNPLFSTIFTIYALTLLYFPSLFLRLFLSPVLIITALLLITLLRLGSSPENSNRIIIRSENANCVNENEKNPTNTGTVSEKERLLEFDSKWVIGQLENGASPDQNKEELDQVIPQSENENVGESDSGSEKEAVLEDYFTWISAEESYRLQDSDNEDPNRVVVRHEEDFHPVKTIESDTVSRKESVFGSDSIWVVGRRVNESGTEVGFVGWDVKAPLEVIYEEYEGQEEEDPVKDPNAEEKLEIGSYPYPSMSFSDLDSESGLSSDGEFPETREWGWPERFHFGFEPDPDPVDKEGLIEIELDLESENLGFHLEEENLIEIDILSHKRKCEFVGQKMGVL